MVLAIFNYVDKLFQLVKPHKTFVLCVDGVAPRAKMNQQRQRRFRAADEMRKARQLAVENGQDVPEEDEVFDSNCITPGTAFMCSLAQHLEYFIQYKLQTDEAWRNCAIVFSGVDVPGEGEHKICDFIRQRKAQPDYSPNEVHCLYGLDADLIMLALATHEPHFMLLREEVLFSPSKTEKETKDDLKDKGILADEKWSSTERFQCLHIGLLREYLREEFSTSEAGSHMTIDLEMVVDDFVLLCFLVGNDFLPSLPTLDIREGALGTLFSEYRHFAQARKHFVTLDNNIQWKNFSEFLYKLGELEGQVIEARTQRLRRQRIQDCDVSPLDDGSVEGFRSHYYGEKLGITDVSIASAEVGALCGSFVEGLHWNLQYYYQGVPSWKWFYPYYFAPLASDLASLKQLPPTHFEIGKPFLPYQQLLAVLPPASARLLPLAYRPLLLDPQSPLAHFLPQEVEIVREAGQAEWEGTVKLPFINEDELLAAISSCTARLSIHEENCNRLGTPTIFVWDQKTEPTLLRCALPDLPSLEGYISRLPYDSFVGQRQRFWPRLCEGVRTGTRTVENIPTFASKVQFRSFLAPIGVNVHGMPSRKESRVLVVPHDPTMASATSVLKRLGGLRTIVYVGWPYHRRAMVVGIADASRQILLRHGKEYSKENTSEERAEYEHEAKYHALVLRSRQGIDLEQIPVLVYVSPFSGMDFDLAAGTCKPRWSRSWSAYAVQLVVHDGLDPLADPRWISRSWRTDLRTCYPVNRRVLCAGTTGAGQFGQLCSVKQLRQREVVVSGAAHQLQITQTPLPPCRGLVGPGWQTLTDLAQQLQIPVSALSLVTSSVDLSGSFSGDLGLHLKFSKRNLVRLGYSRRFTPEADNRRWMQADIAHYFNLQSRKEREALSPQRDAVNQPPIPTIFAAEAMSASAGATKKQPAGVWLFSTAAAQTVAHYLQRFPQVRAALLKAGGDSRKIDARDLCTGEFSGKDPADVVQAITDWVRQQPCSEAPLVDATSDTAPENTVRQLEDLLEQAPAQQAVQPQTYALQHRDILVPSVQLELLSGRTINVPVQVPLHLYVAAKIGDRVISTQSSGTVPLGQLGTVTRVLRAENQVEVLFDKELAMGSKLSGRLRTRRGAVLSALSVLVLTRSVPEATPGPHSELPSESPPENVATVATSPKPVGQTTSQIPLVPGRHNKDAARFIWYGLQHVLQGPRTHPLVEYVTKALEKQLQDRMQLLGESGLPKPPPS
eukprot:TRINITY_DN13446_c0_g1_i1.p1 TRINITY_DN13446_c0_g1~~TRINITY_DN13446_c0_g1_i1.p1  ORF type:complete len:1235 (+),score=168.31 TRINITY_DN13446_c0_g1_i1:850-4554(+)